MESGCGIRCYVYSFPLSGVLIFMTRVNTYVYNMNDCITIAFRCNFIACCSCVHYRLDCVCVCCDLYDMMFMCIGYAWRLFLRYLAHENHPVLLKCRPWEALSEDVGRLVFSCDLV